MVLSENTKESVALYRYVIFVRLPSLSDKLSLKVVIPPEKISSFPLNQLYFLFYLAEWRQLTLYHVLW